MSTVHLNHLLKSVVEEGDITNNICGMCRATQTIYITNNMLGSLSKKINTNGELHNFLKGGRIGKGKVPKI